MAETTADEVPAEDEDEARRPGRAQGQGQGRQACQGQRRQKAEKGLSLPAILN